MKAHAAVALEQDSPETLPRVLYKSKLRELDMARITKVPLSNCMVSSNHQLHESCWQHSTVVMEAYLDWWVYFSCTVQAAPLPYTQVCK